MANAKTDTGAVTVKKETAMVAASKRAVPSTHRKRLISELKNS